MYSHDRPGLENYYGWGVRQNILLCKSFTDVNWVKTGVVLNHELPVQIFELNLKVGEKTGENTKK
jgi:hypothetical protein